MIDFFFLILICTFLLRRHDMEAAFESNLL